MQSLRRRGIDSVRWMVLTKAAGQVITWTITLVVVRLLSPQDYGLMGMAALLMAFLLLFNEVGLGAAIIQKADLKPHQVSDLAWAIFGVNFALFVVMVAMAPVVAGYFREPALLDIVRVLGLGFLFTGLGSPSMNLLARDLAFKKRSQAEFSGNVSAALATLGLALAGFGVWSLVWGYLVQQVVTSALYWRFYPLRLRASFTFGSISPFVHFGFQVASARLLWYAASNTDYLVVGRMLGTMQLGFYSLAFQFSSIPIDKLVSIVTQVAFPVFAALQHDTAALRRYYLRIVATIALITFPVFLGLFLVADSAVTVFLPEAWRPVVLPLQILSVVACFRAIVAMNAPLAMAMGKPSLVVANYFVQTVVMTTAFYVGARYGLPGVSLAWLLVSPVLFAVFTWQTLRIAQVSVADCADALKHPVLGGALMVGVVTAAQRSAMAWQPPLVVLIGSCAIGAAVYGGYAFLFNRTGLRDALETVRPRKAPPQETLTDRAASQPLAAGALVGKASS